MIKILNGYNNVAMKHYKFSSCNINRLRCFDKMPVYDVNVKQQLEMFWQEKLSKTPQNHATNGRKMYILSMFPYPSGQLHMGHLRVYTIADVLARFNRLMNRQVIFPMGWDAFGLPAENAAIERALEPDKWTSKNILEMKQQMKEQMTLSIDWDRELSTCDSNYYKWTQWLFCRLFEKGLVYQKSEIVNWDPIDKTVLADELIDNDGRSWRSGAVVVKVPLKQWFIRTTALSESLLDGLDTVKGGQWRHVIEAQKGWIGDLEGVYIDFDLVDFQDGNKVLEKLSVFTKHPVTALSDFVAFVEINKDSIWWSYKDEKSKSEDKLSFHRSIAVRHPLSRRLIPVIRNSNLKFQDQECFSSRLGLPLVDFKDATLASKLGIPLSFCRLGAYNRIVNSAWKESIGMNLDHNLESFLNEKCLKTLRSLGIGGYRCSKLQRDWLISRQRYWGTPIPIIHCPSCGPVLVQDSQLPVVLPPYSECQSQESDTEKISPLSKAFDWMKAECPKCGNLEAKRESDTMDTFVDSSWYFLRYLDSSNSDYLCSPSIASQQMPVDIYIGGMEHAIRHLYYARFMSHFIHYYTDIKLPNGPEPFSQFLPIGLVLAQTYQTKSGKFIPTNQVTYLDDKPVHVDNQEPLEEFWDKMSKSKFNGINPKTVIEKYGLDMTRLIILANTGPDKTRKWQENDIVLGIQNWEKRIWKLIKEIVDSPINDSDVDLTNDFLLHDSAFITQYQGLVNKKYSNDKSKSSIFYQRMLLDYLVFLYPISPLLSSELWAQLSSKLAPIESVFIETDDSYKSVFGSWRYNLNLPIWEQKLNANEIEIEKDEPNEDVNIVNE